MKAGQRVVLAYLALYYAAPLAGNAIFEGHIDTIYAVSPLTPYAIFLLLVTPALFLIASSGAGTQAPTSGDGVVGRILRSIGEKYLSYRLWFACVGLPLACLFLFTGGSGFRYSYLGISEAGHFSLTVLIALLSTIISADFFYCMFVNPPRPLAILSRRRIETIMLALVLIITANGTVSMVLGLLSAAYAFWPSWFAGHLFMPRGMGLLARSRKTVLSASLISLLFGVSWLCGEVIKKSTSERAAGLTNAARVQWQYLTETPEFIGEYGYYLISSFSSHYYSFLFTSGASRDQLSGGAAAAILHPLQTLAFRLDYVTGGLLGVPRPDVGSLMRLNYLVLTVEKNISSRAGTSPGLLAAFNYVLPFPMSVLACVAYLCWVVRLIDRLLLAHRHETPSDIGLLLLVFSLLNLFQSPVDFLLVVDNSVIYVVLLWGIAGARRPLVLNRAAASVRVPSGEVCA